MDRLKKTLDKIKEALAIADVEDSPSLPDWIAEGKSGFKILSAQDKADNPQMADLDWIGWYTNNFKDLEGEIISEYALRDYVEGVRSGEIPYPELWFSHIIGTKHGTATKLWHVGHFVIAGGKFEDETANPLVKAMKSWYAKRDVITMSHGFMYDPAMKMNGVYYQLETYEISSLIAGSEANPYTKFEVNDMSKKKQTVSDEQMALLKRELGDDMAALVASRAEDYGEELRELGASFKSLPTGAAGDVGSAVLTLYAISKELVDTLQEANKQKADKLGDVDNRMEALENKVGDLADSVLRMTQAFKDLTKRQPAASKSKATDVGDDDEADRLEEENNAEDEEGKPKSVLAKWREKS